MIDIRRIREEPDVVKQAAIDKGLSVDIDALLTRDAKRRELETRFNELRHEQKQAGEQIAKAPKEEKAALSKAMGELKQRVKELEAQRAEVDAEIEQMMLLVPQVPCLNAPRGADERENVPLRNEGTPRPPESYSRFRDHVELGEVHGLFDLERGVKLAGSRNYVLTAAGAQLHEAVMRLAWDMLTERGWQATVVPVLVSERLMYGTGFFPLHRDEVYLCERDEQALVGTSEVPLTGLFMDEIVDEADLPKRMFARSTCFRREAGAAGRDTRGLYRIHFFDKIEQVVVCPADAARAEQLHAEILRNAEELLQALELPYRVVDVCTGDMGQGKFRMYDIETWMPSREKYSETHSASSFHDFQARRLNLRYRPEGGKPAFCYTLNNTMVASPRILIPILENHQLDDGDVRIPERLQGYLGGAKSLASLG